MKKQLFAIAALCTALCACQKASSEQEGIVPQAKEDSTTPQKILLSTKLMETESITKASIDNWGGQTLHVVGYDIQKIKTAGAITEANGFVIPDQKGTAPASGMGPELITFNDGKTFYYEEQVTAYDFNGFYCGDNDSAITTDLYVSGGLLKVGLSLNGSEDILAATTNKDADRVIADSVCTRYGYDSGSMVNKKYVYSAFAARRKVQPKLNFEHMLSKFTFALRIGNVYYNEADSIRVKNIAIAAPGTGTLILNPVNAQGDKINSYVEATGPATTAMNLSCTGLKLKFGTPVDQYTPVPDCLMVIPEATAYTMTITYSQDNTDGKDHTMNVPININDVEFITEDDKTDTFKAGKHYEVKVIIYGLEKIEVSVNLIPWDDAGTYKYDPDDIKDGIE